jgi:RNA polymerase sigma-70 factor (ECF subfamily)
MGSLRRVMAVVSATTPLTDEQLISRFLRGNRSALEELFLRYRETAYRVAHRLLGNEADALDAVQDGFIKALTHLSGFERRSSFKTWLLRIVSNAALDLGRQRSRRETLSLDAAGWQEQECGAGPTCFDPIQEVERADLRQALNVALAELPEVQRRTFVLHVDGGLSYREIAETMRISIGTVMSRLFYARQKLKGLLATRMTV